MEYWCSQHSDKSPMRQVFHLFPCYFTAKQKIPVSWQGSKFNISYKKFILGEAQKMQ